MKKLVLAILPMLLSSCNIASITTTSLDQTIRNEFKYDSEMSTYWNTDHETYYFFDNIDKKFLLDFKDEDKDLIGLYCEEDYFNTIFDNPAFANSDEVNKFQTVSWYLTNEMHKEGFDGEKLFFAKINKDETFQLNYKQYKLVSLFASRDVSIIKNDTETVKKLIYESNYYVTSSNVSIKNKNSYIDIKTGKYCYVDAPDYNCYIKETNKLLTSGTNEFFFDFKNNSMPIVMYDNKECIKIDVELYKNYKNYSKMKEIFSNAKIGEELIDNTTFTYLEIKKLSTI